MARILVTSALPYINGVKHLGNLVGSMLPADVYARFERQRGNDVLYVCATDEHGTPAELAALEDGLEVAEYCRQQHEIQADIYRRFDLSFDYFGRSSSVENRELTQHFCRQLDEQGLIEERTTKQVYSAADRRYLPDRYIIGTCPHCAYEAARGDQCENCTRVLDPTDLIEPRSAVSDSTELEVRETRHLFLLQSQLAGRLAEWLDEQSDWPILVTSIAKKWLKEGLHDRGITRDLSWGVPVDREGFEDKVFYVWFDAPIEYIAATREWANQEPEVRDWRSWWYEADDVRYVQFMAKDNIPFHTISFPGTILGSGEPWKLVNFIKGFNWLTYYGGKFSTSRKRGVFMDRALEKLPADYWRYWLIANAPESDDTDFTFEFFTSGVNKDLADTFGNFVNRCWKFAQSRFDGVVPEGGESGEAEQQLARDLDAKMAEYTSHMEEMQYRKALSDLRAMWVLGNEYLTHAAPWKVIKEDPDQAAMIVRTGMQLIRLFAVLSWPVIPSTSLRVLEALGETDEIPAWPSGSAADDLQALTAGTPLGDLGILFRKILPEEQEALEREFGGAQD
ncbi:MAG: methionine--tRNA ligase [Thermoanaerobaculia bacterium]|jgi:methionyl-tRNA synthetase